MKVATNKKLTKSQQIMIKDGLPSKAATVDQSERNKAWVNSPPKKTSHIPASEKFPLKPAEIVLLFSLLDSSERGAASLACSSHIAEVAVLERLGFARQHGFGPTSFVITPAGEKETKTLKRPEPPKVYEPTPQPQAEYKPSGKRVAPEKVAKVAKGPKAAKVPRAPKVDLNLSPVCVECGVTSKNRSAALDMLFAKIGKMHGIAAVIKAVYGTGPSSEGAADTVIRALQRDVENGKAKDKYEVKRVKDSKGVYSYGLYTKKN